MDGRLVDTRIFRVSQPGAPHLHECVVEFKNAAGEAVRLKVKQTSNAVILPAIGAKVPLLVSGDDTKAVFDKHDPRINTSALARARKQAEQERFDAELRGKDS
ncbi:hypothetical protein GCM10009839_90430 [Catenulispora yoronensis]|uniref:Uncharacterized protein n=1 Tax=Catenulispora yoronensis TaxID=450799 RepID=A0ABN2VKK8_9ACTN